MPSKAEIDDMFLAKAGKCPKCGEFLYIHIDNISKHYHVIKKCLSDNCDYAENISNAYNKAMGLKESGPNIYKKKETEYENLKLVKDTLCKTSIPHMYWGIDDSIKHTIECPNCHMVNNFDEFYSMEYKDFIYECLLCHTEFQLVDMDPQTGIGTSEIIKKGKPQLDTDSIIKGYK